MQSSNIDDPLTSNLRVATFSIAAFDYLQTIPGEIKLYRRQYAQGRMSIVCFLFIVVRYVSIVSLVLNGIGFYSNTFDMESCRKFRLAPPVTKMIAGFASQGLIFLRTWAISRKSRTVLIFLSILCIITVPMMVIGNVYKRDPFIKQGTQKCIAKQLDETAFNSAPMYYGAMAGFDITACAIATYYLIDRNSGSTMSKFTKKVLQHGMMYAFGTTLVNIVVLLGTSHVKYVEKLGAFFSVAVTMIMAQHLVLATQSIKIPPPALEHIAITDRAHTMYTDSTSLSPHTAKPVHDFTAKLTVVHERDEHSSQTAFDPSRRSPIPHFIIDIEQPTQSQPRLLDSRQQSHPSSPVGLAL